MGSPLRGGSSLSLAQDPLVRFSTGQEQMHRRGTGGKDGFTSAPGRWDPGRDTEMEEPTPSLKAGTENFGPQMVSSVPSPPNCIQEKQKPRTGE